MYTIGEVAAEVAAWFFTIGHSAAHTFMEHIYDDIEVRNLDMNQALRYQGDKPAECKYCYETHNQWTISLEHFPPAWTCQNCNHVTSDENMRIE